MASLSKLPQFRWVEGLAEIEATDDPVADLATIGVVYYGNTADHSQRALVPG